MNNEKFMQKALLLARKGIGHVSPNPIVGAVLVKNGKIVGRGFHKKYGGAHAEVNAISDAGKKARGADLYVTLEPCNHYGKQPPCTKAIVAAGISKVYAAMEDPNKGSLNGAEELASHAIPVEFGMCEAEAREQNEVFIKNVRDRMPLVALHFAMTLDGFISWGNGKKKRITGKKAHEFVQELRKKYDGILVGVNTVLKDNPRLTYRKNQSLNPVRIILDPHAKTPLNSKVLMEKGVAIIVVTKSASEEKVAELARTGARILRAQEENGKIILASLLSDLFHHGICSILVEGGCATNSEFIRQGAYDMAYVFVAPKKAKNGLHALEDGVRIKGNASEIQMIGKDALTIIRK